MKLNPQIRWRATEYARHFFQSERPLLSAALRQTVGPKTLKIGDLIDSDVIPELDLPLLINAQLSIVAASSHVEQAAINDVGEQATSEADSAQEPLECVLDPAFLPFAPDSLSTIVLPHILEGHELPHQVLREAHRVLMSEGHIVLTGFNPISLLSMQRFIMRKAAFQGRYYTPGRVIDWLQLLGFEVVASSMFQYAPLSKNTRVRKAFAFLESVGDRWLPMTGGGYMIAAKKREASLTLVGRAKRRAAKPKLTAAAASVASEQREQQSK